MPKGQEYGVVLRVYAHKAEIEPRKVEQILGISKGNPLLSAVSFDPERSMVTVSFDGAPPLGPKEVEKWQTAEFKNAASWLQSKQRSQFEEIARLGLDADVYIGRYWGRIPQELLSELVRLGLGLWFSY